MIWYVDTSALAKLVRPETETRALRRWLRGKRWIASDLHRTELRRAARRAGGTAPTRADRLLSGIDLIVINAEVFDAAGVLEPAHLRSLDALHLAAASRLGDELAGIVAYDGLLIRAATMLGVRVASPGSRVHRASGPPSG